MKLTVKIIPYIIIQILIVTVIGINDLYTMGWDPGLLISAAFWYNYISNLVATYLSFFAWANMGIDVVVTTPYYLNMETNNKLDLNKYGNIVSIKSHRIDELVTNYRTSDIAEFLDTEINFQEKKKKHLYICQNKLMKLRSKKKLNTTKIAAIETMMTDEWINKNLKYYKVKYVPVTEAYLVNGVSIKSRGSFRKRVDSKTGRILKDNYYKLLCSLAYATMFSSIMFDLMEEITPAVIIKILVKISNCIVNSFLGYSYGNKTYITEKVIYELDDRIALMERYIEWKNTKVKEVA